MSRGLGIKQLLFLKAIHSIEKEAADTSSYWRISAVLEQAYALSPELQEMQKRLDQAMAARDAKTRQMAIDGDPKAKLLMSLTRQLAVRRRWDVGEHHDRKRRCPEWLEHHLNPSRTLALLERRGLVTRVNGGVALSDAGRAVL
ncbi:MULTISPECIES: hypothetical protein [unclassified Mesorhizobium]|uniref:hypothetical protein n=1 Tax=unclassified Mesorhizobium TaxID=325217 RepID=UPI00109383CC|nr:MULTISPECIES: hypothetical protein [unclassified Mesorhizobium]TGS46029.1 hypothetical protein EN825_10410 [Mesorhizobium sp. M8A.F.Ca.ET.182.01.1.1]TGS81485.1 hypothetical protein EN824_10630 [Mesorhizobium sp. M8A.F.Ca.ET.181.01.1.1]